MFICLGLYYMRMRRQRYRYREDGFHEGYDPGDVVVSIVSLNPVSTRAAELLVREGFHVRLIDGDEVAHHDLYGCTLFQESDIGRYKAAAVKERLKCVQSAAVVKAFEKQVSEDSDYLLQGDVFLSFVGDRDVNRVVQERCRETSATWGVITVGDGVLHVGGHPDEVCDVNRHGGDLNPADASIAAGIILRRMKRWVGEGVLSEQISLRF